MRDKAYNALTFILVLFFCSCNSGNSERGTADATAAEQENEEWIWLFDGTNTDHWRGAHMDHFPEEGWSIEDGELVNDGSGSGNLVSKSEFSNFILEWEWRLYEEGGNSGLKYFVKETENESGDEQVLGLEYQMLDDEGHAWMKEGRMQPNDYHTTAALYEFFPPSEEKKMKPLGEFNKSRIVSNGNHVEHWLNGVKVVEYERGSDAFLSMKAKSKFRDLPEFGLHKEGHLLLQDHSSKVGFRNIRIKILNKKNS